MWHNLGQLLRYRGLIQSLVARELKARYRGSVLGFFWSFVNPLLMLGIYSFIFGTILPNKDPKTVPYAIFMFCGILPWTWFSTSLLDATGSLISGGNLIKKVLFPAEVLPIVSVLSNMVHFFLGLPILAGFMVWYRHYPDPFGPGGDPTAAFDLLWLPVVMLIQLIFTIGLGLGLSALTVHFRDVRDLLGNLITLWFFCTPIIYPYYMDGVKSYLPILKWNPVYHLVVSYQEVLFFHGPFGHERSLAIMAAVSLATFLGGYWLFDRLRDSFAEAI